ncbi:MAG TPA: c-type cytochrome [Kofleriaceae bacterium]|nr:c-type cytochrome [Kofleriaceae bacterium]
MTVVASGRPRLIGWANILGISLVAGVLLAFPNDAQAQPTTQRANPYDRFCLPCHGVAGDGLGPGAAWLWPRPRNFTLGAYKWRSSTAALPSDDDLRHTIQHGALGTSMHGFAAALSATEIESLVAQIKAFAPTVGWNKSPSKPLVLGQPPTSVAPNGAQLWNDKGCASCHGNDGRGSESGRALQVYDLTTTPLRRPRAVDSHAERLRAVALTIMTGNNGTAMPAFASALTPAEMWALADFVVSLNRHAVMANPTHVPALAQTATDTAAKMAQTAGWWPGAANDPDGIPFGGAITLQGPALASLPPAEASLAPDQCARCHAAQFRQWSSSIHAQAGAPGLLAQIEPVAHASQDFVDSCARCHTPLAEQQRNVAGAANRTFDSELQKQGVACASCHVRQGRRFGPLGVAAALLPLPNYPLTTLPIYERSDFCLPCHQLPAALAVANRPLLNTYKEWLEGPYMKRGVQCQHCHMPNREHTFLGVHDAATFRQAIQLAGHAQRRNDGSVDVRVTVRNVGAGHYLPTTPTPAAWIELALLDGAGQAIAGAHKRVRIGRHIEFTAAGWRDIEDTRIPPGGARVVTTGWQGGLTASAATLRVTIEVHPDDYYEGLYQRELAKQLPAEQAALYRAALTRAQGSYYVALAQQFAIAH